MAAEWYSCPTSVVLYSVCESTGTIPGWRQFGTKVYKAELSKPLTFMEALAACQEMGGTLVTIDSEDENSFLKQLVGDNMAWIGLSLTDNGEEGVAWSWAGGRRLQGYANWAEKEPRQSSMAVKLAASMNSWLYQPDTISPPFLLHHHDTYACTSWMDCESRACQEPVRSPEGFDTIRTLRSCVHGDWHGGSAAACMRFRLNSELCSAGGDSRRWMPSEADRGPPAWCDGHVYTTLCESEPGQIVYNDVFVIGMCLHTLGLLAVVLHRRIRACSRRLARMLMPSKKPDLPKGRVGNGRELHSSVPPSHWCVTREDLKHLRLSVKNAIRDGTIVPTARDNFDIDDDSIGPTMYTVNSQFIMPVCAAAGDMSWALMRNRDGIKCDMFITHAWAEGIFEHIDKVLASWPRGCKGAYLCTLSNPQTDPDIIAHMIATPKTSPFAQALNEAPIMLVVPNRSTSIYKRLWCVYEAFLAYEEGKTILTASPPILMSALDRLCIPALCMIGGVGLTLLVGGVLVPGLYGTQLAGIFYLTASIILFVIMVAIAIARNKKTLRFVLICVGCFVVGVLALVGTVDVRRLGSTAEHFSLLLAAEAFFFASVVDDVLQAAAELQDDELVSGFTRVADAGCSMQHDADAIRAEIGSELAAVDRSVRVLLQSGMSTPSLRRASARNTDVVNAGRARFAFFSVVCSEIPYHSLMQPLVIAIAFICVCCFPLDRRVTLLRTLDKLAWLHVFAVMVVILSDTTEFTIADVVMSGVVVIAIAAGAAGPGALAGLPVLGPWLLSDSVLSCRCRSTRDSMSEPVQNSQDPTPDAAVPGLGQLNCKVPSEPHIISI
eukprot:TRINITY_DN36843_c0_g1_i3.p1 TRINITY_DN36843_c0_g1~~TRINITY_DN36843_c0_g1_i3.p1  ORF type:complete len:834 (-),score=57.36 TRINITY_DN36843_c0_g1_i3:149-2650(-)